MSNIWAIPPYFADQPAAFEAVWQFNLQHGFISIGWNPLGDVSALGKEELLEHFMQVYDLDRAEAREHTQVYKFYNEIRRGDVIVARRGRKSIAGIGVVTRPAYYAKQKSTPTWDADYHFPHHIDVQWAADPRDLKFDDYIFGIQSVTSLSEQKLFKYTKHEVESLQLSVKSNGHKAPAQAVAGVDETLVSASEGKRLLQIHYLRERDRRLVRRKKKSVLAATGSLRCEVCAFDFAAKYGTIGTAFAEVHHNIPLSQAEDEQITRLSDLAVVCANCHRMLHRLPGYTVTELQRIVTKQEALEAGGGWQGQVILSLWGPRVGGKDKGTCPWHPAAARVLSARGATAGGTGWYSNL